MIGYLLDFFRGLGRVRFARAASAKDQGPLEWSGVHTRPFGATGGRRIMPLMRCGAGHPFMVQPEFVDHAGYVTHPVKCPACYWSAKAVELRGWADVLEGAARG